jgi:hypothetical protein
LDGDGKKMFQKYINIPMPVSIGENTAPDYAKFMWLNSVRPLFPEHAPFDKVEKDAITGKNVFYKNGEVVKGKAYEDAVTAANMAIGSLAKDVAREWVESGDNTPVAAFVDKCFFAKLKASKDAKYVNVDRMYTEAPDGEEVCYDRTVALPR